MTEAAGAVGEVRSLLEGGIPSGKLDGFVARVDRQGMPEEQRLEIAPLLTLRVVVESSPKTSKKQSDDSSEGRWKHGIVCDR